MFRHYFLISWRNLLKRKYYSLINVAGLTIGMTCCVLIGLYLHHELSYDQYHSKRDRIYRVTQTFRSAQKGETLGPPVAIVIAVPFCYWAMNKWLQDFAYRISIGPLIFIEAGLVTIAVALATIAWQSVKAALSNPVQSLRNE